MSDEKIIERALYDLLDSIGALSNPHEINAGLMPDVEDRENLLKAREIIMQRSAN